MPERLIDVPLESLPFIDEHSVAIGAPAERVWSALMAYLTVAGRNRIGRLLARRLHCVPAEASGHTGRIGSTIPGFIIARSVPPAVLALMGEHRFAQYALVFRITEAVSGPTRLSAETRAVFPGGRGRAYRMLVIGTRGHALAVRSILRSVRRGAERRSP
ncbi:MAG TPA: hypothetical protein VK326_06790 [Solirubrobacterales bacterium]|nr:hypothetical protein [Solirubrobacterales bacterium]